MFIDECCNACCARNRTIAEQMASGGTLNDLIERQAEKLAANRRAAVPLQDPRDFSSLCAAHAQSRLGGRAGEEVREALSYGALQTADHHGGLYSPMSFQGDLLFGFFLRRLGYRGNVIPILSFSIVRLGNASFARGLMCYDRAEGITRVPLFKSPEENMLVAFAPAFGDAALARAERAARREVRDEASREFLLQILREDYASGEVRACTRYADQITVLGARLSRRVFPGDGWPVLLFLECEELTRQLLMRDLENPDSLFFRMLSEPAIVEAMNRAELRPGRSVSSFLFLGSDRKGRAVVLNLCSDHMLRGRSLDGEDAVFSAEPESLKRHLENRALVPNGYLAALSLAWARGLSWFGGEFQAIYLPAWQKTTAELLRGSGFPELAEAVEPWDCSGYLSSPVFAISPVEEGAAGAGPVEFLKYPPTAERLSAWLDTSLPDAHRMSMFELYHDLVPAGERKEWSYERIAREAALRFPDNLLA